MHQFILLGQRASVASICLYIDILLCNSCLGYHVTISTTQCGYAAIMLNSSENVHSKSNFCSRKNYNFLMPPLDPPRQDAHFGLYRFGYIGGVFEKFRVNFPLPKYLDYICGVQKYLRYMICEFPLRISQRKFTNHVSQIFLNSANVTQIFW